MRRSGQIGKDALHVDGICKLGHEFVFRQFLCSLGKTVSSLRRNLVEPLAGLLGAMGFNYIEKVSKNYIDISLYGRKNRFYLFGGRDESSAALIQGMTLSGILMDEVALMPRSFVEQAMARCSVSGSKMWFNCNPDNPYHWFYREWIKKSEEKMLFIFILL